MSNNIQISGNYQSSSFTGTNNLLIGAVTFDMIDPGTNNTTIISGDGITSALHVDRQNRNATLGYPNFTGPNWNGGKGILYLATGVTPTGALAPFTGIGIYTNGLDLVTVNSIGVIKIAPKLYDVSGLVSTPLIWAGTGSTASNGTFNIDISSAGFTNILSSTVTAIGNTISPLAVPLASIKTISTTAITGNVVEGNTVPALGGGSVSLVGVGVVVCVTVHGR